MNTATESIAPLGNSIRIQQKRDRLLNLLIVSEEHERIAKEKFHRYTELYKLKKQEYMSWCKNNNVNPLIQ